MANITYTFRICKRYIYMKISQDVLDFIANNENADTNSLRLKYSGKIKSEDFPLDFALLQIEARRKCRKKLPSFLTHPDFIFPSLIASEQASNEAVAQFHASLFSSGSSLLDITAGLGIDDMTFAEKGIHVTACEIDQYKCDALIHNAIAVGVGENLNIICNDSIEYLKSTNKCFDVIFADPARRNPDGKRVHALADCLPDILGNMPLIMSHTGRLLIKSSPLLDLSLIVKTADNLNHIYVVCFRGECKEVLIEIKKESEFSGVTCVDLDWNRTISAFHSNLYADNCKDIAHNCKDIAEVSPKMASLPSPADYLYLYEPNAAVMKTGDWTSLTSKYPHLHKADPNTHLFLSDTAYETFPGRRLAITQILDKKALKRLKGSKYNVVARNHPLSASQIANKYGIIPGGNYFIYAFRYCGVPVIITASEIEDLA